MPRSSASILCLALLAPACEEARVPLEPAAPTAGQIPAEPTSPPKAEVVAMAPAEPDAIDYGNHAPIGLGVTDPTLITLIERARASDTTHERITALCDDVGHRLAGSPGLDAAVDWAAERLREDGQENVRTEPVMVPVWIRGEESAQMVAPRGLTLPMLGLGGSVGTPPIEAPVEVVRSFEELGPHVDGHIVVYDYAMSDASPAVRQYGDAVKFRGKGASKAAEHGAVAVLVRSVTARSLGTPHTGGMGYEDGVRKIPGAAITTEHAGMIGRLRDRGVPVRVRLAMEARTEPDVLSHNVIGEITGARWPEEVVLIGAHLDSWDVGQGAHDDGAGVVEVIEALRHIRGLAQPPARTIRAVLFTNEENGLRGGKAYAEAHGEEVHVAAIETDLGGGWPIHWSATGTDAQLAWLRAHAAPLGMGVTTPGGGADISPLKAHGVLVIGLRPDDRHYFDYHHTWADTVDKIDPAAMREATAAVAGLAWQLANAPSPTAD